MKKGQVKKNKETIRLLHETFWSMSGSLIMLYYSLLVNLVSLKLFYSLQMYILF